MARFRIAPHFRLQEWVAEEKGYFRAEGLDYEFSDSWGKDDPGRTHAVPNKVGAYQSFEDGSVGAGRYAESVVTLAA